MATWLTSWSGVPGGIFAPSLSIGGGIGHDVAMLLGGDDARLLAPSLIALGMAGFLAATTQAPLTSFIIVMEMINGRSMVLSLMAAAMLSSLIARLISRPLYSALAGMMARRLQRRGGADTVPHAEPVTEPGAEPLAEPGPAPQVKPGEGPVEGPTEGPTEGTTEGPDTPPPLGPEAPPPPR